MVGLFVWMPSKETGHALCIVLAWGLIGHLIMMLSISGAKSMALIQQIDW